jgi:hypothetical protein
MGFKEDLEQAFANKKNTAFQKANLNPSPRKVIKRIVNNLFNELKIKYREEDSVAGATEMKDAERAVFRSAYKEYKQLEQQNYDDLVPEIVTQGKDRGKVVDEEVREEDENLRINKILSRIFRNITIRGKAITLEVLNETFSKEDISIKNSYRGREPSYSSDRVREKITEDDTLDLEKVMPLLEKVFEGIDRYYDEGSVDGDIISIDIKDDVASFIGNEPYIKPSKRKAIYSSWKSVAAKHKDVYESVKALKKALGSNSKSAKLNSANEIFNNSGQYVVEFKSAKVKEQKASSAIFTLIERLEAGKIAIEEEGIGVDGDSNYYTEILETEVLDSRTVKEINNLASKNMDPLGYSYLTKYTHGILTDATELDELSELAEAAKELYGFDSEQEVQELQNALDKMGQIKPVSGKYFLPIQITLDGNISRLFGPTLEAEEIIEDEMTGNIITREKNPTKISGVIKSLLSALEDILMEQKMTTGQTVVASRGGQSGITGKRGYVDDSYISSYPSVKGKPKKFDAEIEGKIKDVLSALDEYLYKPLLNPAMTLDLDFRIKGFSSFKSIRTMSSSDFSRAYNTLTNNANSRRGRLFRNDDLKNIRGFLKSINTPNIDVNNVIEEANKLTFTIKRLFRDRQVMKQYKEEMAAFIGILNLRSDKQTREMKFQGITIPSTTEEAMGDETRPSRARIEATSLTVMATLKEFLLDEANQTQISSKGSVTAKEIKTILNELRKSDMEEKILEIHDSLRILKGLPVYYGQGSISSIDDMDSIITSSREKFNLDLTSMDVVKMVEEVDSFSNISSNVGVSEEVVYFVKANFR